MQEAKNGTNEMIDEHLDEFRKKKEQEDEKIIEGEARKMSKQLEQRRRKPAALREMENKLRLGNNGSKYHNSGSNNSEKLLAGAARSGAAELKRAIKRGAPSARNPDPKNNLTSI
jgi:hypothetical protein